MPINQELIDLYKNGKTEQIKDLIEKGADFVNAKDNNGFTTLMYACENGGKKLVKLLITKEAIAVVLKKHIIKKLRNPYFIIFKAFCFVGIFS